MELLLVFASLKLQLSALQHGLYYISCGLVRSYVQVYPDVGGRFERMLPKLLSFMIT
jgi:hypothetical protein